MGYWDDILGVFNNPGFSLFGGDGGGPVLDPNQFSLDGAETPVLNPADFSLPSGSDSSSGGGAGIDWGGVAGKVGSGLASTLLPMAGGLATAGIANALFPTKNTKGQIVTTDTRTAEGSRADQARMGAFERLEGERAGAIAPLQEQYGRAAGEFDRLSADPGRYVVRNPRQEEAETGRLSGLKLMQAELAKALSDPYYGSLPSDLQAADIQDIQRERRSSDAARGMLETGGSGEREAGDIRRYRTGQATMRNARMGSIQDQINALSGGYQGPINQTGAVGEAVGRTGQAVGAMADTSRGFSGIGANLLSGFQPQAVTNIPPTSSPNPWAALTTQAVAPEVMKALRGII